MGEETDQLENLLEFLYACPAGLVQTTADGTIAMINPMAMKLLLPIANRGVVTNLFKVLTRYSTDLRDIICGFSAAQGTLCENHRIFVNLPGKNGAVDPLVLACTLIKINEDRLIATVSDVSQQVVQERRLKQAETWFATLLDSVNDFAVISLDSEGRIEGANDAAAFQTGYSHDLMIGQPLEAFDAPARASSTSGVREQIDCARRDGWHLDEGWRGRADGQQYWCQRLIAVRGEEVVDGVRAVTGYTVVLRDVTRGDTDGARLRERLTTDHLTGACNRAHFFDLAERQRTRASQQGEPLALIAMDIDHFKRVNDSHGHAAGDAALKALTRLCRSLLRPSDTFARIGGEEFVVLMPGMDLGAAIATAERLRVAVAALPIALADQTINVTASFGCAVMTSSGETLAGLLEEADRCLYLAKRGGRDRVEPQAPDNDAQALLPLDDGRAMMAIPA